jgi:endonuclease/exonuclease/phosphatase family metal-dependent hydrolase
MSKVMKYLVILVSILFLNLASATTFFSMNLHCGLGDWKSRVDIVVKEVLLRDPDIIGFQEVCYNSDIDMTKYIIKSLKAGGYPVTFSKTAETHRTFIKYREQLLIITKRYVTNTKESWLPSMKFFENKYLAIEVDGFWAITSHLHFALPQIREKQFELIAKRFSDKPVILFGDLNSNPSDAETNVMKKNWVSYYGGPTYPSANPDKTFDGFWATKVFADSVSSSTFEILFKNEVNAPSDHLGIWLEVDKR